MLNMNDPSEFRLLVGDDDDMANIEYVSEHEKYTVASDVPNDLARLFASSWRLLACCMTAERILSEQRYPDIFLGQLRNEIMCALRGGQSRFRAAVAGDRKLVEIIRSAP